jgi:hypothetical protein
MHVLLRHSRHRGDVDRHGPARTGKWEGEGRGKNQAMTLHGHQWKGGGREEKQAGTCGDIITRRHTHGNLKARSSFPLLVVDVLFTPGLTPMLCHLPGSIKSGRDLIQPTLRH